MRTILSFLTLAAALSGCTTDDPGNDRNGGDGRDVMTPRDVEQEKKRVLECLRTFEGRDPDVMDAACEELREIGAPVVSEEILGNVERFGNPRTRSAAHERLRWMSKVVRMLLLLESTDKEDWKHCYAGMVALGPEATLRFVGVLILKMNSNPAWCRAMLLDVCNEVGPVAQNGVLEALNYTPEVKDPAGPLTARTMDDKTREGIASVLIFLKDPPASRIRESALNGPIGTRRALAKLLAANRAKDKVAGTEAAPGWAIDILVEQLSRDPAWQVRADAADSLGRCGDLLHAAPALILALKDKDHWVRRSSCIALGQFGAAAKDSVGPMIEMLKGLDAEKLEGNPRRELDNAATDALRKITGKRFNEPSTFLTWWDEQQRK